MGVSLRVSRIAVSVEVAGARDRNESDARERLGPCFETAAGAARAQAPGADLRWPDKEPQGPSAQGGAFRHNPTPALARAARRRWRFRHHRIDTRAPRAARVLVRDVRIARAGRSRRDRGLEVPRVAFSDRVLEIPLRAPAVRARSAAGSIAKRLRSSILREIFRTWRGLCFSPPRRDTQPRAAAQAAKFALSIQFCAPALTKPAAEPSVSRLFFIPRGTGCRFASLDGPPRVR
jgi:hypothetical protein